MCLTFDAAGVRRIVEHMTAATDWSRGFGDTSQPRPQVVFVKDEGIKALLAPFPSKEITC
jgi:hypothetical protein